jgi:UDP-glucose 4-epimerase
MILLTGANGFIGSALKLEIIARGQEVALLGSRDFSFSPELESIHNKITSIVVCGGYVPHSSDQIEDSVQSEKSNQILELIFSSKFPALTKIIFLSSCDVYLDSSIIDENSNIGVQNLYTQTKIRQESLIQEYCKNNELSCIIIRLGNVYGPGQYRFHKLIPKALECAILDRELLLTVTQKSKIQPVYISDVVSHILWLNKNHETDLIVNLVGPQAVSVSELIQEISKLSTLRVIESEGAKDYLRIYKTDLMFEVFQNSFIEFSEGLKKEFIFEAKRLNLP